MTYTKQAKVHILTHLWKLSGDNYKLCLFIYKMFLLWCIMCDDYV